MASEIYHRLREQLDQYSVGYPATESGVELRTLEKLFSEGDARLYLDLSLIPVPADSRAFTFRLAEERGSSLIPLSVQQTTS